MIASSRDEDTAVVECGFWEKRGRPEGSPNADWYRAEQELTPRLTPTLKLTLGVCRVTCWRIETPSPRGGLDYAAFRKELLGSLCTEIPPPGCEYGETT